MSEWNEERLDKELQALMNEMPEQEDLEKKIIKSINRRIRRIVLRTLAGIIAVVMVAVLIINPVMNSVFFNPYKLNEDVNTQEMLGVMRDYVETIHPYREVLGVTVEKKGFARYDVSMQVIDRTKTFRYGEENVWYEVNRGTSENVIDPNSMMDTYTNTFRLQFTDQEEIMKTISELPASARVYLSVSDVSPKKVEELRNMEVTLDWVQVYQPDVRFQGGLCLSLNAGYENAAWRKYMTEEELLEEYLSNLENMLEHEEVWLDFGLSDGRNIAWIDSSATGMPTANTDNVLKEVLTETYEDAKNLTALLSENYCVYGKRDEVLGFLEENTLDSIYIENVELW